MRRIIFFAVIVQMFILSGSWEAMNGPAGGYVRSILYFEEEYFAATGGGVLASPDGGEFWEFRNSGLGSNDTKSLAMIDSCIFVSSDDNVYRSFDHGQNWETAGDELSCKYVKTLIALDGVLFAGTYLYGIYRSEDLGSTWEHVNNGIEGVEYIYWLETDGENIYAGTYLDGLFRSSDMGESWQSINTGLSSTDIMAIHYYEGIVFLSTLSNGVFYSTNSGDSWFPVSTYIPSVKGFYHSQNHLYAASFNSGVYRSADSGDTWNAVNSGLYESGIWAISGDGSTLMTGHTSGHIFRSLNSGDSWGLVNGEISYIAPVGSICCTENRLIAGNHGSGLHTSDDLGETWIRRNSINTVEIRSVYFNGTHVLAGTDMLGIYSSTNNGTNFNQAITGLGSAWIQGFTYKDGNYYAASRDAGVFCWYEGSGTWVSANSGINGENITALSHDENYVYAGTFESGVYSSSDEGQSWQEIFSDPLCAQTACVMAENGVLMAGTRNHGLFVSYDQGQDFIHVLGDRYIECICYDEELFFCGTHTGEIFASENNGAEWISVKDNIPNTPVFSMCIFEGFLWTALNDSGVWRLALDEIVFFTYGDIDDNSVIESFDAALALQYLVGINNPQLPMPWTQAQINSADVDGDSAITAYDSALILRYAIGMIEQFPVVE